MTGSSKKSDSGHGTAGAARLRDRIDRGGTGDKVAFSDPAAAPLGTDDEAAGTPPTEEQVRRAAAAEDARATPAPDTSDPAERQRPVVASPALWGVLLAIVLVVAVIWLALS